MFSDSEKNSYDALCRTLHDNIAMLSVQLNHLESDDSITTHPDLESLAKTAEFLSEKLESLGIPMKTAARAQIALDEIYSNIIHYSGANLAKFTVFMQEN